MPVLAYNSGKQAGHFSDAEGVGGVKKSREIKAVFV